LRRLIALSIFISFTLLCDAQKDYTAYGITKILRGQWVSREDTNFVITIKGGDTLIESRPHEAKRFEYTLGKESCDPSVDAKLGKRTSTGYYINESRDYDGTDFCNALLSISDTTMVWLSIDGTMHLNKKK
jgi:hypothetical protein